MSSERSEEELPDGLKALESELRLLQPTAARIDRDRLMYVRGQSSVIRGAAPAQLKRWGHWLWPLSTAASVLVSLILAGQVVHLSGLVQRANLAAGESALAPQALADRSGPAKSEPYAQGEPTREVSEDNGYLKLRIAMFTRGLGALNASSANRATAAPREMSPRLSTLRDYWLGG